MEVNLQPTNVGGGGSRPPRTVAIKKFLEASTLPDLAALYHHDMECQVIVARDGGDVVRGEYRGREYQAYSDGHERWKSFRIPYKAGSTPEYSDKPIGYDLGKHAEGIGMTGWNWKERKSIYVAFDFDSMIGHADGLTEEELEEVRHKVEDIPWVTVRKSTSGNGYHLYVFVEPVETANHHEHAALARAILSKMSSVTGFDFATKVDICGGNMWVWHRKMYTEDDNGKKIIQGYELVKQGELLTEIPKNWQAHIRVAKKQTRKTDLNLPQVGEGDLDDILNERALVPLDEEHVRVVKALDGTESWWDPDHHLLVTHTWSLKQVHESLELKGMYDTISTGAEGGMDHNCFCIPRRNGAWVVRRYSQVAEGPPWFVDRHGFSCCYFNSDPDLETLSRSLDGIETEKRGFLFQGSDKPEKVLQHLGTTLGLPEAISREVTLKAEKDGRVVAKVKREDLDRMESFPGFEPNKDGTWTKVIRGIDNRSDDTDIGQYDHMVRHLISESNTEAGWVIATEQGFINEPLTHVKLGLQSRGYTPGEVTMMTGTSVLSPWKLVNIPFEKEYPGDRQWNREAPQLRYQLNEDRDALHYPTWLQVLQHCGTGLDDAVQADPWCQQHGIDTGADYLKCWCASMFQEPEQPLPYLFFYGPQNSGKSVFHEALGLLFSPGYMKADNALTNNQNFNGELQSAILCVIEETDLSRNKSAYNKIKDWVTSQHLAIRPLYQSTFMIKNMTHWVQCANEQRFCPILPGDTRVVIVEVPELTDIIPKKTLMDRLKNEASDFLTEMMRMTIPPSPDRLNIPPVRTEAKDDLEASNRDEFQVFLDEMCYPVPGEFVTVKQMYETFLGTLNPAQAARWGKVRMNRLLPTKYPKGRHPSGQHIIGNISFSPDPDPRPRLRERWVKVGEYLQLKEFKSE